MYYTNTLCTILVPMHAPAEKDMIIWAWVMLAKLQMRVPINAHVIVPDGAPRAI